MLYDERIKIYNDCALVLMKKVEMCVSGLKNFLKLKKNGLTIEGK
jgi:hypothetical protein